jgi:hypothetical protein
VEVSGADLVRLDVDRRAPARRRHLDETAQPVVGAQRDVRGEGRGTDLRQLPRLFQEVLEEGPLARLGVPLQLEVDAHVHHAPAVETRVDRPQVQEGADEQAGQDQQHQGEGDLPDHQRLLDAGAARIPPAVRRPAHQRQEPGAPRPGRGDETAHQAGENRKAEGEGEHAAVDGEPTQRRQVEPEGKPLDGIQDEQRQDHTEPAAEQREREALGQELAHQPAARDSEGHADTDLLPPGRGFHQEQPAQVRADDQHQQADHGGEHGQRIRDHRAQPRRQAHPRVELELRSALLRGAARADAEREVVQAILGPFQAHAGSEPAQEKEHPRPQRIAQGLRPEERQELRHRFDGEPEIRLIPAVRAAETGRGHADHRIERAVGAQPAAEGLPDGGEVTAGEAVGDHHLPVGRGPRAAAGTEQATLRRLHAQRRKEVVAHRLAAQPERLPPALDRPLHRHRLERGELGKHLVLPLVPQEVRVGKAARERLLVLAQDERLADQVDQAARVRNPRRQAEEHLLEKGEHRHAAPDPEGQAEQRDGREAAAPVHLPESVAQVERQAHSQRHRTEEVFSIEKSPRLY